MRTRHPPGGADQTDYLPAGDSVPHRHKCLAEVEIRGDETTAVIDVDNVAGEKEVVDERDNPAIGGAHGLAYRSAKINTQVATRHPAVEQTPRSKFTRDRRRPRTKERRGPHQRRVVRVLSDLAGTRVFAVDPRPSDGNEGARKAGVQHAGPGY